MTEEITLFDPTAHSVIKYDGLKGEQSVTYNGTWHVTEDQIKEGKIKYFIRYYVKTADGLQENKRTIPVTIQTETAAPQMTATYTVTPSSARKGRRSASSIRSPTPATSNCATSLSATRASAARSSVRPLCPSAKRLRFRTVSPWATAS